MERKYPLMVVAANNLTFPNAYYRPRLDKGYGLEQQIRKSKTIKRIEVTLVRKDN